MCSIDQDANDELLKQSEEAKQLRLNGIKDGTCNKCQVRGPLVYHGKDFICHPCFLIYCSHKFRSTIGKAHVVRHGDKILVAFSGGVASAAMLHMILQGLSDSSHKRIKFHPSLLYIHENGENNLEESKQIVQNMIASGLPCYVSSLDMYFRDVTSNEISIYEELTSESFEINDTFKSNEKLIQALNDLPHLSSKEDYIKQLRLRLISEIGQRLSFNHIFVGDTSSYLAVEMLTGISLGRGNQIPSYVGFVDKRYGVSILRPLREFQIRDIALYNHYSGITSVIVPSISTMIGVKGSIRKLTETFVNGLQEDFPATIPTIFRTGDKICSTISSTSKDKCVLCSSMLDTSVIEKYGALEALLLSQQLCKGQNLTLASEGCGGDCTCSDLTSMEWKNICSELCYSCQCLAREANGSHFMPEHIVKELGNNARRRVMKKEIQEFLCDSDEDVN